MQSQTFGTKESVIQLLRSDNIKRKSHTVTSLILANYLAETMTFGPPGESDAHVFLKAHQFRATGIAMVLKIQPFPLDPETQSQTSGIC